MRACGRRQLQKIRFTPFRLIDAGKDVGHRDPPLVSIPEKSARDVRERLRSQSNLAKELTLLFGANGAFLANGRCGDNSQKPHILF